MFKPAIFCCALLFVASAGGSVNAYTKELLVDIDHGTLNIRYIKIDNPNGYDLAVEDPCLWLFGKVKVVKGKNNIHVDHKGFCFKGTKFYLDVDPSVSTNVIMGGGIVNVDSMSAKQYVGKIRVNVSSGIINAWPFGRNRIGISNTMSYINRETADDSFLNINLSAGIVDFD